MNAKKVNKSLSAPSPHLASSRNLFHHLQASILCKSEANLQLYRVKLSLPEKKKLNGRRLKIWIEDQSKTETKDQRLLSFATNDSTETCVLDSEMEG